MMQTATTQTPELWTMVGRARPEEVVAIAQSAERDGWHGLYVHDSQNLWGDPFVSMTLSAVGTKRLQLGIASTNPGTRHPATMAGAIASVAAVAGPRVSLGIARGDSALAHIGSAPVTVARFEEYVGIVRRYLAQEPVKFDELQRWRPGQDISTVPSEPPPDSRLHWLNDDTRIPIEVFASGPRMINVGVHLGDRITFGLGADRARLEWAVGLARSAAESCEQPKQLSLGTFMHVAPTADLRLGREMLAGALSVVARFSALHGRSFGPTSNEQRSVFEAISKNYDTAHHAENVQHARLLPDEFVDSLAIIGPPEECVDRIQELVNLGIHRFMIALPSPSAERPGTAEALHATFVAEVMPYLSASQG